jgi:methyltransferase
MSTTLLALLAFGPMLAESVRSSANERALRAGGAVEPAGDVYAAMRIVYPACFLAMMAESVITPRATAAMSIAGLIVFSAAKLLKYWAVAVLGARWTFRVLVPPGSRRTVAGPYRFVRHPNYLAVVGELGGFALLAGAFWTGAASLLTFGALLRARILVEDRALGSRAD